MPHRRPDAIDRRIGRNIQSCRAARGWTQTELAERIGVTYQQVQKYERGSCRVAASMLFRIGRCLEVSLDTFLPLAGDDKAIKGPQIEGSGKTFGDELVEACINIARKRLRPRVFALVRRMAVGPTQSR
jgi:transcriptional regulator with XRE-family HTH domain